MNIKSVIALTVAIMVSFTVFNNAFAAQQTTLSEVNEAIPGRMTCEEFINMNPKAMAPVAFWVINKNSDFTAGDYVDWHDVETIAVPKMLKQCQQAPRTTLAELTHTMK